MHILGVCLFSPTGYGGDPTDGNGMVCLGTAMSSRLDQVIFVKIVGSELFGLICSSIKNHTKNHLGFMKIDYFTYGFFKA